ncbi:MAG: type II and III secretion system protein [Candidatus Eremiobacteraeota bacterium]|nr:type II and III secretion system protein [Candidatus Eremiobacteraeota bacterium]
MLPATQQDRFPKNPKMAALMRLCAFAGLVLIATSSTALAYTAKSTLTDISANSAPNGGAQMVLRFDPALPKYSVSGENTSEVDITFEDAAVSAAAQRPVPSVGALKSLKIQPKGTGFVAHLALTGANALGINRSGNTLEILIAGVVAPAPSFARTAPAGGGISHAAGERLEIVPLKYADVSEVAGIFSNGPGVAPQDQFARKPSIFGLPNASYGAGYAASASPIYNQTGAVPSIGQRITPNLAIDRRLNAAVLFGANADVVRMRAIIAGIDVPTSAVALDCQVIELNASGAQNVGVDYDSSGAFASASLLAGSGQVPQTNLSFQARVLGEMKNGNGHLLATPQVVALNGQVVTLIDGDAVPVVSSQLIPGPPVIVQENVSYINVGVHLQVQPRVSGDGNVTSHIFAEFSNVTASQSGPQGKVPEVTLRQTTTTAIARDGQPFIIGGFLRVSDTLKSVRTPGLGSIPLLGNLFRVVRHSYSSTNLYIIITPHILHRDASGGVLAR